jgi:acetyl esterase/lipase
MADVVSRTHVYARIGGLPLELDLHRPTDAGDPLPAVLYLHGGGWSVGRRSDRFAERVEPVVEQGLAVASVSYRLTDVARWPAQLHDVRTAVRWLRANASDLRLRADAIGAWGASAGGHLALLAALAPGEDAALRAVATFFAPADLLALARFRPGIDAPLPPVLDGRVPEPAFETRLLGAPPPEVPGRARDASPVHWAGRAGLTRFLLVHGDADGLVPVDQSRALHAALTGAGAEATLLLLGGADHEDPLFERPAVLGAVGGFLRDALAAPPRLG